MTCRKEGHWWVVLVGAGLLAVLAGCEKHEFDPPDREARVEEADSLFDEAVFDTIAWPSDSLRALDGNGVYAARCRQCHGSLGRGDTPYAAERGLDVPSLVREGWAYEGDLRGVRRRIFTGHRSGMPTWGVAGVSLREIDATAYYILEVLRPEVLAGG